MPVQRAPPLPRRAGQVSAHALKRHRRRSNIRATMDYYANVDRAVEEAFRLSAGRNNQSVDARAPIQTNAAAAETACG
jgi:hypothetical protein